MSRKCQITNKGAQVGRRVSHSHIRTKHKFLPNLQKKKFWSEEQGRFITLKIATSTMRTIDKLGLDVYARKVGFKLPDPSPSQNTPQSSEPGNTKKVSVG